MLADKKIVIKIMSMLLKLWDTFKMKAMKDYHEYLDDVFEKFRNSSLKIFGLDSSHYLSALTLSCDAMLNMKKS